MYRDKKIGVVVPAYKEELLIKDTLKSIPNYVDRVYVVNDCSPDRTGEIIAGFAEYDARVVPLTHEVNKGPGAAIVTGYNKALLEKIDIVATMDGDNQMDPAFLPDLLDPIVDVKCDFTMGNRLINAKCRKGMSKWRLFGNAILTFLTKIASGYWQMMDPQNGYTAISARALKTIDIDSIYPRYGYLNDRLVRLNISGFRVRNIPHPSRYQNETSGIRYRSYITKVSWLLLKSFLYRMKTKYVIQSFHPLVLFYFFGTLLSSLGVLMAIITIWEKFIEGYNVFFVHGVLSFLTFMLGMMFLLFAMFFDMQQEKNTNGWY